MSGIQQLLLGGSPAGYQIERSLRFNSADSAYLNRTPASAGNLRTWTWSAWVKRSALGGAVVRLFNANDSGSPFLQTSLRFDTDQLRFYNDANSTADVKSSAVYRDASAWYHIVCAIDTTQATAANRVKLYVNGSQVTALATATYPNQNTDMYVNAARAHQIGSSITPSQFFDGYLTEINFIDGQALTPSSFGQSDPNTGVWSPIKYTGTYGTNGFYLNFSDNSNTTSTTLGKDSSGNGNNWTPSGFSVTAGAGNDSLVDTPTSYGTDTGAGGEVRGNYATWNPLDKNSNGSLVNGNLDNSNGSANNAGVRSTFALPSSDKWYAELRVNSATSGSVALGFGFSTSTADLAGSVDSANKYDIYGSSLGYIFSNTSTVTSSLGTFTSGDILQIAYDGSTGKAWLGKNNTWYNSTGGTTGNPGAGTNQTFTLTGEMFLYSYYYNISGSLNTGQRPFAYTAPSGFKALCTQNLPTPTIGATSTTQAGKYFNPVLYTGTGATQSITGVGFQPDFVWIKSRSAADNHILVDAVRGTGAYLFSDLTNAEVTGQTTRVTSFDSNGFSLGSSPSVNTNATTYVAWNWKANGAGGSNTAGSITSTVSANTTSGFSIVTYTGNGTNGATVGHGLGVAPSMIIVKWRSGLTNNDWDVYHSSLGATKRLFLNLNSAAQTSSLPWNDTAPSSTVFTLGTGSDVNNNTTTYVAYCFAAVAGYSAFGSYTGNGSTDGVFVYTGFRPKFIMVKNSSNAGYAWLIWDSVRETYNVEGSPLFPNLSNAEGSIDVTNYGMDFVSNGFKIRATGAAVNNSGHTYIYAAFAESPFKYSLAR